MNVGNVCNRKVVTIGRNASLIEAAQHMRMHGVETLVVVDEELPNRAPVGLLSDRDIVVRVVAQDPEDLDSLLVGDVMIFDVVGTHENDSLDDAITEMGSRGTRRMPVVNDDGELVGLLDLDDVLASMSTRLGNVVDASRRQVSSEDKSQGHNNLQAG